MVVVIFAGLPLVSLRGEHVVFDSLDPLPAGGAAPRAAGAWSTCCARGAAAGLAWLMWVKAGADGASTATPPRS